MKAIQSWKDCTDSRKVEYTAVHSGFGVRNGKGSHKIIEAPNGDKMPFYDGDISTGVACKLYKWFKEHGAVLIIPLLVVAIYALCRM